MLDTIRVKYPIAPTKEQLSHWQRTTRTTQAGAEKEAYYYNPKLTDDEIMLKYTYYPVAYDSKPMLTLEVSLPKLIFGNNFQMIQSVDGAIKVANQIMTLVQHAPILDLAEGVLLRMDMCYNYQVGDAVDDYIKAIGYLDYPHRRTKYHRHEGAEFRSKHKTSKFYNKLLETGSSDAYGLLRHEVTILKGKNIQKLTGVKKPTLKEISRLFVKEQLEEDLARLRLLDTSIANQDTALKALTEAHGSEAAFYYFGVLMSRMQKTKKQIAKESDMHPRSLDRRLRKIVDSGIALTLTDRREPLQPLEINL